MITLVPESVSSKEALHLRPRTTTADEARRQRGGGRAQHLRHGLDSPRLQTQRRPVVPPQGAESIQEEMLVHELGSGGPLWEESRACSSERQQRQRRGGHGRQRPHGADRMVEGSRTYVQRP